MCRSVVRRYSSLARVSCLRELYLDEYTHVQLVICSLVCENYWWEVEGNGKFTRGNVFPPWFNQIHLQQLDYQPISVLEISKSWFRQQWLPNYKYEGTYYDFVAGIIVFRTSAVFQEFIWTPLSIPYTIWLIKCNLIQFSWIRFLFNLANIHAYIYPCLFFLSIINFIISSELELNSNISSLIRNMMIILMWDIFVVSCHFNCSELRCL